MRWRRQEPCPSSLTAIPSPPRKARTGRCRRTSTSTFNWDYDEGRQTMMGLYRKGVEMQWNAETRIDWTQELDEDNPEQLPEEMLPISGMAEYEAMSRQEKAKVRRHFQGWQISQFMQGEQGALICAAKIVTQVPDVGFQVLRLDPGDRRGAPRRELQAPAGKVRRRLSDDAAAAGADRPGAARQPLGHDLPRHAGGDRGPGAGRLPADPRPRPEPAGRRGQRLRDAGREPSRRVRPPGAARLLSAADPEGARRARGVPARSLLPDARPLRRGRGVEDAGPRSGPLRRAHVRLAASWRCSARRCSPASCRS